MRILYVASTPKGFDSLNAPREIYELHRRFLTASAQPISFVFLPDVKVEDLPAHFVNHTPDVLHFSVHGEADALYLANEVGDEVRITAKMLRAFFNAGHPPRLVYVNACNSEEIAGGLVSSEQSNIHGLAQFAIGTTASISNRTARAAAVAFYERILAGDTVQSAFFTSQQLAEAIGDSKVSTMLYSRADWQPGETVLYPQPRIIAGFQSGPIPDEDGDYEIRLGIMDCPSETAQVVFFTNDSFFAEDSDNLAEDLCLVVRDSPNEGLLLAREDHNGWYTDRDFRLTAIGTSGDGHRITFTAHSLLSDALERAFAASGNASASAPVLIAIKSLKRRTGWALNAARHKSSNGKLSKQKTRKG